MAYRLLSITEYPNSLNDKVIKINEYIIKYNNLETLIVDVRKEEYIANEKSYRMLIRSAIFCFILIIIILGESLNFGRLSVAVFVSVFIGIAIAIFFVPKKEPSFIKEKEMEELKEEIEYLRRTVDWERDKFLGEIYERRRKAEEAESRKLASGWVNMSGHVFEKQVGELYLRMGFSVEITKGSGDGGIDLYIEKEGIRYAVQCKNHHKPIAPASVRDFYGAMMHDKLHDGIFISSGGFTKGAREFADGKVKLLDVNDLVNMNNQIGIIQNTKMNNS